MSKKGIKKQPRVVDNRNGLKLYDDGKKLFFGEPTPASVAKTITYLNHGGLCIMSTQGRGWTWKNKCFDSPEKARKAFMEEYYSYAKFFNPSKHRNPY